MAFSDDEVIEVQSDIEKHFWSKRCPPLEIREQVREGQRVDGLSVELFFVRPVWDDPSQETEESIAKATLVRSRGKWRVYWKRADLRWHSYAKKPEVNSLPDFLKLVDEDRYCCFFG